MSHNVRPISAEETSAPILLMTSIMISVWTSRRVGLTFVHLVRLVTLERKKIVNLTVTPGTLRIAPASRLVQSEKSIILTSIAAVTTRQRPTVATWRFPRQAALTTLTDHIANLRRS